ncbi:MAG: hypothetical protein GY832_11175 [Chloroflexi bacterium]|nr:hypothetical protein [Chloroflexota bacterium]
MSDFIFVAVIIWFLVWAISSIKEDRRKRVAEKEFREAEQRVKERMKKPFFDD